MNPWVKLPNTAHAFDEYIERFDGQRAECTLICIRETGRIVGAVTMSEIIRGPYQLLDTMHLRTALVEVICQKVLNLSSDLFLEI